MQPRVIFFTRVKTQSWKSLVRFLSPQRRLCSSIRVLLVTRRNVSHAQVTPRRPKYNLASLAAAQTLLCRSGQQKQSGTRPHVTAAGLSDAHRQLHDHPHAYSSDG